MEAAADIEDERQRSILLCILQQEVAKVALTRAGHPQDERVRNLAIVEIQEVWGAVVRFERSKVSVGSNVHSVTT